MRKHRRYLLSIKINLVDPRYLFNGTQNRLYSPKRSRKRETHCDPRVPTVTYFSRNDGYSPGTSGEINFARVEDNADGR